MGLYVGGLIIGRIFVSEIWRAYFREGLFYFILFYFIIIFFFWRGGGDLLSEFCGILCDYFHIKTLFINFQ